MHAFWRTPRLGTLSALILGAYLLALLLGWVALVRQAQNDIAREIEAAGDQAARLLGELVVSGSSADTLRKLSLRHLQLIEIDGTALPTPAIAPGMGTVGATAHPQGEAEGIAVPVWFLHLIWHPQTAAKLPQHRIALAPGHYLLLQPNPADEAEEIWESALQLTAVFAISALLTLLLALGWQTPVRQLRQALSAERADNRRLTEELMAVSERESARLARELHDDLGQYLTGLQASALLIETCSGEPDRVATTARRIRADCQAMQSGFRRLIHSLHPVVLTELGLGQAVDALIERWQDSTGVAVSLTLDPQLPDLDPQRSTHVYRLIQEALNNVARHAGATRVEVVLQPHDGGLSVSVADNGCGIRRHARPGLGLRSMQERARQLNTRLQLESAQGRGLALRLHIPLGTAREAV